MALARSASGPGGLSINTSSANSLFGSSNTTPATGGMFGNTQASKPATGLFGAATPAPQTGGVFGSSTTTSAPQAGGVFAANTATSQPQATGLFGTSTATSQPQTGGLFGSAQQPSGLLGSANTTKPQQTGGLFGASTTASQPAPALGGGLFSGLGAQTAQNHITTGGLFGGLNAQNQNKPATSSLFGTMGNNQSQASQAQAPNMFSSLNANSAQTGSLGGGLLGGGLGHSQNQQTVPGVRIDITNVRGTTRFNDLHEDLQKKITHFDEIVQAQIRLSNDCDAIMPSHNIQLQNIPPDVEFVRRKLIGVDAALEQDAEAINAAQELVRMDAENAKLSFKAIDNLKLPPQFHHSGIWQGKSASNSHQTQGNNEGDSQDLVGLFSKTADELGKTLESYQKTMTNIEQHVKGVESSSAQQVHQLHAKWNGSSSAQDYPVQELAAILREFEQSLLGVAGKVGATRESVQKLQLGAFNGPTDSRVPNTKRSGVY